MSSSSERRNMNMLTLKSSDNEEFMVVESAFVQSVMIKKQQMEGEGDCEIALNKHADSKAFEDDLINKFDAEFLDKPVSDLLRLLQAVHYLDIKDLICTKIANDIKELICKKIANDIKDKSVEEVRRIFNITSDYTPEEEEKIRSECAWAFQE